MIAVALKVDLPIVGTEFYGNEISKLPYLEDLKNMIKPAPIPDPPLKELNIMLKVFPFLKTV